MKVKFLFSESPPAGNMKFVNLTLGVFFAWTNGAFGILEMGLWSMKGFSDLSIRATYSKA